MYHLEDLPKNKLKQLFNSNPVLTLSEKFDGSAFSIGVNSNKLTYVKTKTNCWYSEDEIPNNVFFREIKKIAGRIFHPSNCPIFKTMYCFLGAFELQGELIPCYDWNTVIYPKEKIGNNGLFVLFNIEQENKNCPRDIIKIFKENYMLLDVCFAENLCQSKFEQCLYLFKTKHQELINKAVERGNKSEELELRQLLREFTKTQVQRLEQFYNYDYHPEGFVVRVGSDAFNFKLVDKDEFTVRNQKNWEKIIQINKFKKQLEKLHNKEQRAAFRSEFMKYWHCHECQFPNPRKFRETTEYLHEILQTEWSFKV